MTDENIIIESGGLMLRRWREDDALRLQAIANNKNIYDNLRDAFPYPYTLEDAKKYIASACEKDSSSDLFAIEKDGNAIGSIGAFLKDDIYRKNAEIGYYLDEKYWGRGIMAKAISALLKYLFENYDIIRIYAEPFERNSGSRRALEKAGFTLEAILKRNVIKNGIVENSCIYSILR